MAASATAAHGAAPTAEDAFEAAMRANSAAPPMSLEDARALVAGSAASPELVAALSLEKMGIHTAGPVYVNLSFEQLNAHCIVNDEVAWTGDGVAVVDTGKFTGRSPHDKFFVEREPSASHIDWGSINQPTTEPVFDALHGKALAHLSDASAGNADPDAGRGGRPLYVFLGYAGHSTTRRLRVCIVTTYAWQHWFSSNMFVRPEAAEVLPLASADKDFVIFNACGIKDEEWAAHGLKSETFVVFDLERRMAVIGDTRYGGEMKKGIFSVVNYLLPRAGHLSMHCAANADKETGDTALFFGLSGTGKTTLSTDPARLLIGDDEHVWDDEGIFNVEGGCYAKTKGLRAEFEPDIVAAIRGPAALLENVALKPGGVADYDDCGKTQNGRVSYPLEHIESRVPSSTGKHPRQVIFLTADAFGVLPPVSRLTEPDRAMYWFMSGFTAKVAGTERGVTKPEPTFSHSFGSPFFPLHAADYAELLGGKLRDHGASVYLVNSGWTGGPCGGGGHRMPIKVTRACVAAIVSGALDSAEYRKDACFGVDVPVAVPGVDSKVLTPRDTWADAEAYDKQASQLAKMFRENYEQFKQEGKPDFSAFAPPGPASA